MIRVTTASRGCYCTWVLRKTRNTIFHKTRCNCKITLRFGRIAREYHQNMASISRWRRNCRHYVSVLRSSSIRSVRFMKKVEIELSTISALVHIKYILINFVVLLLLMLILLLSVFILSTTQITVFNIHMNVGRGIFFNLK